MEQTEHPLVPKIVPVSQREDGGVVCEVGTRRVVLTRAQLAQYIEKRENGIRREREDPFNYGRRLASWDRADAQWNEVRELLILGGNRSSKTEYAARMVVETLVKTPGARVWCLHTSAPTSISMQQNYVHKYLPPEWKGVGKKGAVTNISYTQKNGFSENTFVCPNGSQCWFMNYMQDDDVIEGGECDFIWCDELVPLEWVRTLRFRLVTRRGRLLVTFTPVDGYTATVKEYVTGARTLLDTEAPLLPVRDHEGNVTGMERVPLVQDCVTTDKPARVVYFHTVENVFSDYEAMVEELRRATRDTILCRAYGVPVRAIAGRFPKFSERVHVVRAADIPKVLTRYQIVDPCSGRNWFMTWVGVDVRGRMFVYREWPGEAAYIDGVGYPGPWTVPGKKLDGERGPAQKPFGFGLNRYKEEIERLEKGERIVERFMDSRFGNSSTVGKEIVTTLLEECADVGMDFAPAPGEHIDEGVDLVNDLLAWDETRPVDATNEPRLYVSEECTQTIYALKEWTGADGRHGACKDPVDNLRYAVLADLSFAEGDLVFCTSAGGAWTGNNGEKSRKIW